MMPTIRKRMDLLNNYSEISNFCRRHREPIFITENGQEDLAVMSMETYEELAGKLELYQSLQVGLHQIKNGEIVTEEDVMEKLKQYEGTNKYFKRRSDKNLRESLKTCYFG